MLRVFTTLNPQYTVAVYAYRLCTQGVEQNLTEDSGNLPADGSYQHWASEVPQQWEAVGGGGYVRLG